VSFVRAGPATMCFVVAGVHGRITCGDGSWGDTGCEGQGFQRGTWRNRGIRLGISASLILAGGEMHRRGSAPEQVYAVGGQISASPFHVSRPATVDPSPCPRRVRVHGEIVKIQVPPQVSGRSAASVVSHRAARTTGTGSIGSVGRGSGQGSPRNPPNGFIVEAENASEYSHVVEWKRDRAFSARHDMDSSTLADKDQRGSLGFPLGLVAGPALNPSPPKA